MFFAATVPGVARRGAIHPATRMLQRLREEAARGRQNHGATVEQDATSTTLRFDVPGVAREQLSIGIEADVVRIHTLEGAPRQYRMAYRLPQAIVVASSSAKLENGVLTVRLVHEAPRSRVIELAVN